MNDYSNIKTVDDILKVKREDISQSFCRYLFANVESLGRSRFEPTKKVIIPKGKYYNNKTPIVTSLGNYIINYFLFNEQIYNIIGFINKKINNDDIEDINSKLSDSLLDGKIETKYVIDYLNRIQFFGFSLDSTATSSISEKTMFEIPAVNKRKKELEKKYAKEIAAGDIVTTDKIQKELLDLARKEIGDDYGMEIYNAKTKPKFDNQYKVMNIMKGSIKNVDGEFETSMCNYNDGVSKEDSHLFANAQIDAQFNKSVGTQDGGYLVKKYLAALQAVVLDEKGSDCGTNKTFRITVTKFNKKLLKYRYMKSGNKKVLLTEDVISNYVGRAIDIYDPIYCCGDFVCNKCAGDLYYKLGIKNIGTTASRIGSTVLNKKLKKMHDSSLKLYDISNLDDLVL